MGQPLELGGSYLKTEEGNEIHYYGGGSTAYDSTALACAGVPLAVRKGKTVGVWENGKVVEYCWHTDTSNSGLIKKTVDVNLSGYQPKEDGKGLSTNDFSAAYKSKVDGIQANATANSTDAQLRDRSTHTGTQLANTISDFTAAVFAAVIAGLAPIAGTPGAGDTVAALFGKLKYLYDNLPMLVRAVSLAGVDTGLSGTPTASDNILQFAGRVISFITNIGQLVRSLPLTGVDVTLTGTPVATDTNLQFAGRVINFISTISLKVRGTTLSGFVKTNAPVSATDTVETAAGKLQGQIEAFGITGEKLNTGNNDSLAGDEGGLTYLSALGRILRIPYIWWIPATRELQIGNTANPGKLTIGGTTSATSIPSNVANGNAQHLLNPNQSLAWQIIDKAGTLYDSWDTASKRRTNYVSQALDRGFQSPVVRDQVSIASNGAGVKVYGQTTSGLYTLPMAQAGVTLDLVARFKFTNSTASSVIAGTLSITARRVGATVTILYSNFVSRGDTSMLSYTVGAEVSGTDILLFFTPGGMDSAAYTGCFYQIEYNY